MSGGGRVCEREGDQAVPRLPYVGVPADADQVEACAKEWALDLAIAYAHVRRSLPEQDAMLALGAAAAYYVLRRGSPGQDTPYDTGQNGVLPCTIGSLVRDGQVWKIDVQTP